MSSLAVSLRRFLGLCAVAWLMWGAPARAEPLRTVVRIAEEADRALLERVRGQASDLSVELTGEEAAPLEESRVAQLEVARELGRSRGAEVVVWFARAGSTLEVLVADLTAERLFARSIERGEDALAGSAQDEAAGLVVRSALRASLLGAALGTPREELAPKPPPPSPPQPKQAPPAIAPVEPPAPPAPRLSAALGVAGALDGATDRGQLRAQARVAAMIGALELGVLGAYGFRSPIANDLATLRVAEHRAGAFVAFVPRFHRYLAGWVEGGVQLAVVTTQARSRRPDFAAESGRMPLAAFDLGVGLRGFFTPRFGLQLSAGATAFSRRLVFGYGRELGFRQVKTAWPVEPRALLELWAAF